MMLNPLKTLLGFALLALIAAWMGCADSAPVAPHPAGKAHLTLTCPDSTQTATDSDGDGIPDADSTPTYVTFADSSLERAVRTALGAQVGGDPTLSLTDPAVPPLRVTDLASLTRLRAVGRDIRNLDGLQHATALNTLYMSGNDRLEDVSPLSSLTSLDTLFLNRNDRLEDVSPLSSLTSLRYLGLSGNARLTSVDSLASLTNLRFLRLQGNALLTDVNSLASLTNLDTLKMHTSRNGPCKVSDLSSFGAIASLPNLELITVVGCPLSEASRTALDTLEARIAARRARP